MSETVRHKALVQDPIIAVEGMWKSFGDVHTLRDVSMGVRRGTALAVLGPSGAGKTTLLRCFNLLTVFERGRLLFNGEVVAQVHEGTGEFSVHSAPALHRQRVGMVFQEWSLWPTRNVRDNIAEGPRVVRRVPVEKAYQQAETLAAKVGVLHRISAFPSTLSGGEKQRVAIARALAMNPEVLLLDEITSALDPGLVREVLDVVMQLKRDGTTMIVVTHHLSFARAVADRVVVLADGAVVESGETNAVLDDPKSTALRGFLADLAAAR